MQKLTLTDGSWVTFNDGMINEVSKGYARFLLDLVAFNRPQYDYASDLVIAKQLLKYSGGEYAHFTGGVS